MKIKENTLKPANLDIESLVTSIKKTHNVLLKHAKTTIDKCLTIRNWLFGYYLVQYEQNGSDRAKYGEQVLETVSAYLKRLKVPSTSVTNLRLYRQFYRAYPQIRQTLSGELPLIKNGALKEEMVMIHQTVSDEFSNDIQAQKNRSLYIPGEKLLASLSFSHFVELTKIDDLYKRAFYEMETIKSQWGVRELKRQMNSMYYERLGLSKNKKKLLALVENKPAKRTIEDEVKDPYIFEFLGAKMRNIYLENDLRDALTNKLQDFILELGKGFCFEDRNKKILIGDTYYWVDLVFFHRILRCNILFEIKLKKFTHKDAGQLNAYLNYYKKYEMNEGDNPPIGILLCADKDHALVEFSLAGMDNKMFVSKYKLELPSQEELQQFVETELKELYNF